MGFADAYFEAVSGLTATGATVLSGLDKLPPSINLWRTELHWIGGLGIIVLAVAILPMLGVGGRQLMKAEVPSPIKEAGITPRVAETAKGFWKIYIVLTLLCTLAYGLLGMGWLDALTHAFSTVALGGFSSHDASLGFFDSPALEAVTILFALGSGISYVTHFAALSGRSLRPYLRDGELRFYLGVLAGSVLLVAVYIWQAGFYAEFATALRHAAFNTVSVATTLGYASTDYSKWPFFAPLWMLFLCSFVTCAGSTGGGLKMMRAIVLYKQVFREIVHAMHPNATTYVKLGGTVVPNKIILAVLGFGFLYMASTIFFTLALAASGADIVSAFSAAVACFNNTGPGLGLVGPDSNYGVFNDFQVWICSFAMLLGRLEIFTLLVVLTPAFWRK
jgi:trk system potassium uptake protein TrkH